MKKIIKKKKAFTLVELMGLLVIIGVLSAILIPVINNVLKENKEKVYQIQLQNITLSAKNFVNDNKFLMPETEGETISLTLGQLKKSGYIEHSVINPKTKQEISNCLQIEIKKYNNNYEYTIRENTLELDNCNENYSSDVLISGPSKQYIKNGDVSSYILIISPTNEEQVLSYSFNDSKLSLGAETDAKYSVVGENGIYKIIIKAGEKDEDIELTFGEGTITDSVGNNVDISNVPYKKITVDNTAPTIPTITLVYEDNGETYNQSWTNRNVKQIQSSTDSGVGGVYYQYGHDNSSWEAMPQDWIIRWDGSWTFYVRACDSLGNCSSSAPPYWIGIDKIAPVINIPTMEESFVTNQGERRRVFVEMNESGSGIIGEETKVQYEHSTGGTTSYATWAYFGGTSPYKFYQHFGYDDTSSNILKMLVTTKDYAGNTSSRNFVCSYRTNQCGLE